MTPQKSIILFILSKSSLRIVQGAKGNLNNLNFRAVSQTFEISCYFLIFSKFLQQCYDFKIINQARQFKYSSFWLRALYKEKPCGSVVLLYHCRGWQRLSNIEKSFSVLMQEAIRFALWALDNVWCFSLQHLIYQRASTSTYPALMGHSKRCDLYIQYILGEILILRTFNIVQRPLNKAKLAKYEVLKFHKNSLADVYNKQIRNFRICFDYISIIFVLFIIYDILMLEKLKF